LHSQVKDRIDEIEKIVIDTQEAGVRIIDKTGPLNNPADRDHCIQYMVAVPLLTGGLTAADYEDDVAADPRVDELRNKMEVKENKQYSIDYLDAEKRSISNSVQIFFKDGSSTENIVVEYPIGHRRRREVGIPVLEEKFKRNLTLKISGDNYEKIIAVCSDQKELESMPVNEFMDLWVVNK